MIKLPVFWSLNFVTVQLQIMAFTSSSIINIVWVIKKNSQWEHLSSSGAFCLDLQKLTAEGHKQYNLTMTLPLQGTAQVLANTQEKGR